MTSKQRRGSRPRRRVDPSELSFPEQVSAARDAALRLLAVRERSAMELRLRLRRKGFDPNAVAAAVDRLREVQLQSDERFAERYAQGAAGRGKSDRLIRGELRSRGLEAEVAAGAAASRPEEERARALALARSRASRLVGQPASTVYRRVAALLARRGYEPDICRSVAEEVVGSELLDPGES